MLGVKTAAINASACATAPLGPVIGLVGAGATGVEGDRFPLVQQIFQDVHVPSQDLSECQYCGSQAIFISPVPSLTCQTSCSQTCHNQIIRFQL